MPRRPAPAGAATSRLCAALLAARAAAAGASNREVEHVVCQVCRLAAEEAPALLEGGVVDEESVEALCSARRAEGRWLTRLDLEQDAETIRVVRREEFGECRRECLTVQRACARAFEGREEAVARLLLAGADAARLRSEVCSSPCAVLPRPLARGRRDEVFRPAAVAADAPGAGSPAAAAPGGGALQEAAGRQRQEDTAGSAAASAAEEGRPGAHDDGESANDSSRGGGDEVLQVEVTKKSIQERAGGSAAAVEDPGPEERGAVQEVQVIELGESQNASELLWNALRELLEDAAEDNSSAAPAAAQRRGGSPEGEAGAGRGPSEPAAAGRSAQGGLKVDRKVEIDHVKCPVCRLAVAEAAEMVEKGGMREDEDALADVVESLCSVNKRAGRWLTKLDLQQEGDRIQVVQHSAYGECRRECLTVQRACTKGLQGQDASLVRLLAAGAGLAPADADEVCRRACRRPPEPVRGERRDEAFEPKGALESAIIEAVDELNAQKQRASDGHEEQARQAAAQPAGAAAAAPRPGAADGGAPAGGRPDEAPERAARQQPAGAAAAAASADAPGEEDAGLAAVLGPAAARLLALWLGARRAGAGAGAWTAAAAPGASQALAVAAAVLVWLLWLLWRGSAAAAARGGRGGGAPGPLHHRRRGAGAGREARGHLGGSGEDAAASRVAELAEALRSQEDRLLEARHASRLAATALARAALAEAAEAAALAEDLREELALAAPAGAALRRRPRAAGAGAPGGGGAARAARGDACAWCGAERPAYMCQGCGLARYCGPGCQRLDWRGTHRVECGRGGS